MPTAKFPGSKPPKKPKRKNKAVPVSMRRMFERALVAPEVEVEAYQPTPMALDIADGYLSGARTHAELQEHTGHARATISATMRDPVVCAWISKNLHAAVQQRLGLIDAAMFSTAVAGNVPAAKLCFERYGQIVDRKIVQHVHTDTGIPFDEMPTEDLEQIVKSRGGTVIDVTKESPE
jgi:hypothetical protein